MIKIIKKQKLLIALLLVLIILSGLTGCKKKDKKDDEYQPTSGLVMTGDELAALNGKVRVIRYFPTTTGDKLVGEVTLISVTAKDKKAENLIIKVLEALMQGPKDTTNLKNLFPKNAKVKSVKLDGDCVVINFDAAFKAGLPENQSDIELLLYSIANTLTEFKDINCVKITSGSEVVQSVVNRKTDLIVNVIESSVADYSEEAYADIPME